MTEEEATRLYKRAIIAARKLGFFDMAYDYAADMIVCWLAFEKKHGRHIRQTVTQGVIDQIRRDLGRTWKPRDKGKE